MGVDGILVLERQPVEGTSKSALLFLFSFGIEQIIAGTTPIVPTPSASLPELAFNELPVETKSSYDSGLAVWDVVELVLDEPLDPVAVRDMAAAKWTEMDLALRSETDKERYEFAGRWLDMTPAKPKS